MMNRCLTRLSILGALVVWLGALPAHGRTRQVVLLYDERTTLPGLAALDASIVRTLTSSSAEPVEVYRESMDLSRFGSDTYLLFLQDYLRTKYADKNIDVVVAVMSPALDFLLSHGSDVFRGTPIVFCGIDRRELGGRALPSRVTGVVLKRAFAPTLDIALKLHPGTRRVVFVAGTSEFDRRVLEQAREELSLYKDRLDFTYLTALPMRDLLSQLSELPPHTIVLYSTVFKDGEGTPFVPHDVAERLAAASNAPVYGFLDQYLGRGIVGGRMYSLDAQGEAAANLVLKVLAGMPPSNIPVVEPEASVTRFDWRQLQRWGIRENQLPQGSAVLFRQLSFWDQYKLYVIEGAAIVALQSVIIGGLLLQRKRRRRAEASLRESERRFRLVANTAPVLIWMSGPDKLCNYFNQPWLDFTGRPLEAELGNGRSEGVHPEDLKNCLDIYTRAFDLRESFKMQYRLRRHDGEYRWLLDIGVPRLNPNGAFAGYIGSCIDVTDRKLAEEALAGVGRRLIEAHEEERTWLARELHDDINQRIALLAVQLEQWAQNAPYSVVEVTDHIRHVRQDLSDLGKDVQALSHRLHSSKLEYLGIAAAASGFCKELSEQQKIEIDFSHAGVPLSLPKEISLCLFRVLQEALQNAIKHSGERHFKVELRGTSSEIQLTVSDSGVGFDQQDSIDRRGIGLVSMRERLNLVGGEFSIESKHGSGTTIRAQVPYMAELRRASTVG